MEAVEGLSSGVFEAAYEGEYYLIKVCNYNYINGVRNDDYHAYFASMHAAYSIKHNVI